MEKRKILIIAGATLLIIIIAIVLFLSIGGGGSYRNITVVGLTDSATVSRISQTADLQVYPGMKLQSGDLLTVSDSGTVSLKMDDDKFLYLEQGSKITLTATGSLSKTLTKIDLLAGAMTSDIERKLNPAESYSVTASNVAMSVRGTIFRVAYVDDGNGGFKIIGQVFEGDSSVDLGSGDLSEHLTSGLQAYLTAGGNVLTSQAIDFSLIPQETLLWLQSIIQQRLNTASIGMDTSLKETLINILAEIDRILNNQPAMVAGLADHEYAFNVASAQHGFVQTDVGVHFAGESINITAYPDDRYKLTGWLVNGILAQYLGTGNTAIFTMPSTPVTVSAQFEPIPGAPSQVVNSQPTASPPPPAQPKSYTLKIEQSSNGTVAGGGAFTAGKLVTMTATPADGYEFVDWSISSPAGFVLSDTPNVTFAMPPSDVTLHAEFEQLKYAFTVKAADHGKITALVGSYPADTQLLVSAEPDEGYEFDSWVVRCDNPLTIQKATSATLHMPDAPVELTAVFKRITYQLNVQQPASGTISDVSGEYPAGAAVTISAAAPNGFAFNRWVVTCSVIIDIPQTAHATFHMPKAPVSLRAEFYQIPPPPPSTYHLTVQDPSDPTVSAYISDASYHDLGKDNDFTPGAAVIVNVDVDEGQAVAGWLVNGVPGAGSITYDGLNEYYLLTIPSNNITIQPIIEYSLYVYNSSDFSSLYEIYLNEGATVNFTLIAASIKTATASTEVRLYIESAPGVKGVEVTDEVSYSMPLQPVKIIADVS